MFRLPKVKLTLEIRSIQVNVMGEVVVPELIPSHHLLPYFMLYIVAGGVNPIGSLRSIKVIQAVEIQ